MKGGNPMGKKFVDVTARFSASGKIKPLNIIWDDGRVYEIDRVDDIHRAASLKAGGIGLRFTCMIRNKQIYLFMDENIWFMEVDS